MEKNNKERNQKVGRRNWDLANPRRGEITNTRYMCFCKMKRSTTNRDRLEPVRRLLRLANPNQAAIKNKRDSCRASFCKR